MIIDIKYCKAKEKQKTKKTCVAYVRLRPPPAAFLEAFILKNRPAGHFGKSVRRPSF